MERVVVWILTFVPEGNGFDKNIERRGVADTSTSGISNQPSAKGKTWRNVN